MKKKIIVAVLSALAISAGVIGITACKKKNNNSADVDPQIYAVYQSYVAAEKSSGNDDPLSYDDWLLSIVGDKGDKGDKGDRGPQGPQGPQGNDGRGIDHVELNADGDLLFHYTDGTSETVVMPKNFTVTVTDQNNTPVEGVHLEYYHLDEVGTAISDVADVVTNAQGIATYYMRPQADTSYYVRLGSAELPQGYMADGEQVNPLFPANARTQFKVVASNRWFAGYREEGHPYYAVFEDMKEGSGELKDENTEATFTARAGYYSYYSFGPSCNYSQYYYIDDPNPEDTVKYPLGEDDPQYQADLEECLAAKDKVMMNARYAAAGEYTISFTATGGANVKLFAWSFETAVGPATYNSDDSPADSYLLSASGNAPSGASAAVSAVYTGENNIKLSYLAINAFQSRPIGIYADRDCEVTLTVEHTPVRSGRESDPFVLNEGANTVIEQHTYDIKPHLEFTPDQTGYYGLCVTDGADKITFDGWEDAGLDPVQIGNYYYAKFTGGSTYNLTMRLTSTTETETGSAVAGGNRTYTVNVTEKLTEINGTDGSKTQLNATGVYQVNATAAGAYAEFNPGEKTSGFYRITIYGKNSATVNGSVGEFNQEDVSAPFTLQFSEGEYLVNIQYVDMPILGTGSAAELEIRPVNYAVDIDLALNNVEAGTYNVKFTYKDDEFNRTRGLSNPFITQYYLSAGYYTAATSEEDQSDNGSIEMGVSYTTATVIIPDGAETLHLGGRSTGIEVDYTVTLEKISDIAEPALTAVPEVGIANEQPMLFPAFYEGCGEIARVYAFTPAEAGIYRIDLPENAVTSLVSVAVYTEYPGDADGKVIIPAGETSGAYEALTTDKIYFKFTREDSEAATAQQQLALAENTVIVAAYTPAALAVSAEHVTYFIPGTGNSADGIEVPLSAPEGRYVIEITPPAGFDSEITATVGANVYTLSATNGYKNDVTVSAGTATVTFKTTAADMITVKINLSAYVPTLAIGEANTVQLAEGANNLNYLVTATDGGTYEFTLSENAAGRVSITCNGANVITRGELSGTLEIGAGETVTVTITSTLLVSELTITVNIAKQRVLGEYEIRLNEPKQIEVSNDINNQVYYFIPASNGVYTLTVEGDAEVIADLTVVNGDDSGLYLPLAPDSDNGTQKQYTINVVEDFPLMFVYSYGTPQTITVTIRFKEVLQLEKDGDAITVNLSSEPLTLNYAGGSGNAVVEVLAGSAIQQNEYTITVTVGGHSYTLQRDEDNPRRYYANITFTASDVTISITSQTPVNGASVSVKTR